MYKKSIILFILIFLCVAAVMPFVGCSTVDDGRIKVVCTNFPTYDWVMNVLGERASEIEVTYLFKSGVDPHNYSYKSSDGLKIAKADLFIYVGGESDKWVPSALAAAENDSMRVINLMEVLGEDAKEEEAEGDEEEAEEEEEIEYDEHVWLSLRNAKRFVSRIAENMALLDPDYAETYAANAATYVAALDTLDARYASTVEAAPRDTILVADRFPFRYLTDDYAIKHFAAANGCAAAVEPSPSVIMRLTQKVNELNIRVLLVIEKSDQRIAETIRSESRDKDQDILVLDSLQSTTTEEYTEGRTYLSVMENNLTVLERALA